MRHVLICLALATGLSACDGENSVRITTTQSSDDQETGVLKVIDTLQCPDNLGVLTRKGLAAAAGAASAAGEGASRAEVVGSSALTRSSKSRRTSSTGRPSSRTRCRTTSDPLGPP